MHHIIITCTSIISRKLIILFFMIYSMVLSSLFSLSLLLLAVFFHFIGSLISIVINLTLCFTIFFLCIIILTMFVNNLMQVT